MGGVRLTWEGAASNFNADRNRHWSVRARMAKAVRTDCGWLWRQAARGIHLDPKVRIVVEHLTPKGNLPDAGACFEVAKAIIDAAVDVRVIGGDDPTWVSELVFRAPVRGLHHAVTVTIEEIPCLSPVSCSSAASAATPARSTASSSPGASASPTSRPARARTASSVTAKRSR
jgi:hypothetical protein